jgi:Domain of unknown function (DUF4190)
MTQGSYGGGPGFSWGPDPFEGDPFAPRRPTGSGATPQRQSRGETNTLATLSVVFAFVFAPAGLVLGHLSLGQIVETGEFGRDRALVGTTLSYMFIIAAIVALAVWTAGGNAG